MRNEQKGAPLSLFYLYAHVDELFRIQLEKHLILLRRQGYISEWHNREILPGTKWSQEIDTHLETASIILLLISPDFLASDYCYEREMQHALERHKRKEARVVPVILRPCDWHHAPFANLQRLPRDGKPVTMWGNQDEAFDTVTQGLRRIVERQKRTQETVTGQTPVLSEKEVNNAQTLPDLITPPSGLTLLHTLKGHTDAVWSVTWSPDGRLLASSGSRDQTVRLWDPITGKLLHILEGHTDAVWSRLMAGYWPPSLVTRRCDCGTRPLANCYTHLRAIWA